MNATFDEVENTWKALHPAAMYRAHQFASNLYRHELCKGLRSLGYEIQNHQRRRPEGSRVTTSDKRFT